MNYASVVFPLPQDIAFTYAIPQRLKSIVHCGSRVVAPLRRRPQEGVIVALLDEPALPDHSIEIKNLSDCLDGPPNILFGTDCTHQMDGRLLPVLSR